MTWELELILLVGVLLGLMAVGVWIPVALALAGLAGLVLHGGLETHRAVGTILWNLFNDFTLTAIPLFILLGEVILRSPMNERMFRGLAVWLRQVPGGLLHASLLWTAIFSALSGVSVATAATVGTVAIPELLKRRYEPKTALGALAAGATLDIMIPPSVPLIIYGVLTQESVVRLYMAAIGPSLLLLGLFGAYIVIRVKLDPRVAPPGGDRPPTWGERGRALLEVAPVAGLMAVMLGGMFLGIMTPTEAAGVSAAGALLLSYAYGGLTWRSLRGVLAGMTTTTSMVLFIVAGAQIFSFALVQSGIAREITHWMVGIALTPLRFLAVVTIVYLIMGCFFDPLSTLLLTLPVLYPTVQHLGLNPLWFGIFLVVLIETGLITPPVGLNLFVIKGIARGHTLSEVAMGALPFVALLLVGLGLLIVFPELTLWLPEHLSALSARGMK